MTDHLCNASFEGTKTPIESLTLVLGSTARSIVFPKVSGSHNSWWGQTLGKTSVARHLNSSDQAKGNAGISFSTGLTSSLCSPTFSSTCSWTLGSSLETS